MKRAPLIATCCVASMVIARAETLPIYEPDSRNVELIVTLKGKPPAQIPVSVNVDSLPDGEHYWSGITNEFGKAFPRKLAPGRYRISAQAGRREATTDIDVTGGGHGRSTFEVKLYWPRIRPAEESHINTQLRNFSGVVLDPSGASLPQTDIEVFRKDSVDADPVLQIQADEGGHFSGHLPEADKIALFHCPGFLRLTQTGEDELRLTLQVGTVAYNGRSNDPGSNVAQTVLLATNH